MQTDVKSGKNRHAQLRRYKCLSNRIHKTKGGIYFWNEQIPNAQAICPQCNSKSVKLIGTAPIAPTIEKEKEAEDGK